MPKEKFDSTYFDENYYSRKNFLEVLFKGGYVKSNDTKVGFTVKWKSPFVFNYYKKKSGKVIDLGCGTCHFLKSIPKKFYKYGTDISEFVIKDSQKKNKSFKLKPADITKKIPFREKFDVMTAFDTLEHINNLNACLKIVDKSLASNGLFFVAVPVKSRFHEIISKFGLGLLHNDPTHVHKEPSEWWVKQFEKHFEVVDSRNVLFNNFRVPGLDVSGLFVLKKK